MEELRHYVLDRPRVVSTFPSERNDNALVEDQGGRKIVLRRFRRNTDRKRIAFQLDVQEHLAARGIPTPAILPTRDGQRVTPDDPPCVAFDYVDGASYSFTSLTQTKTAAETLARVHHALDDLTSVEVPTPLNPHIERWWRDPERELDALAPYVPPRQLARLEQTLGALDLAALATLPAGLVHGDFHGRNVLFRQDKVVALLDFDVVHRTIRATDVARALLAFARPSRGSLHIRPEVAAAFLSQYARGRSLTEPEREALPTLLTLVYMPRVAKCTLLAAEGGDASAWATERIEIGTA